MPDNKKCHAYGVFRVPVHWVGTGNFGFTPIGVAGASNDVYHRHTIYNAPATAAYTDTTTQVNYRADAVTANLISLLENLDISIAPASTDYFLLRYTRDGTHASDTLTNDMDFIGWKVTYGRDR
jgi:hypothetical protein